MSVELEIARSVSVLATVAVIVWRVNGEAQSPRSRGALFLSAVWSFVSLLAAGLFAGHFRLTVWSLDTPLFQGVPVAMLLAGSLATGPLPAAACPRLHILLRTALGVVCLGLIGLLFGNVAPSSSHRASLIALAIAVALPAQALMDWTARDIRLYARTTLQTIAWLTLLLWVLPATLLGAEGVTLDAFRVRIANHPVLWLTPLTAICGVLVAAVWQFATEGQGTPFPYDPPKRLVRGSVYAYVANPMQIGICALMVWWGLATGSVVIAASGAVAIALFVVFSDLCSGASSIARTDPDWAAYRRNVRGWIPRLTPWSGKS